MFHKNVSTVVISLFLVSTAFAGQGEVVQQERAQKLARVFSLMHAVNEAAIKLSDMAEEKSECPAVKAYAKALASQHAKSDLKLLAVAKTRGVEVSPLDAQTPQGRTAMERVRAEAAFLNSIEGSVWDHEYLTLVGAAQNRAIRFLDGKDELATDPEVKSFINDLSTVLKTRRSAGQFVADSISEDNI